MTKYIATQDFNYKGVKYKKGHVFIEPDEMLIKIGMIEAENPTMELLYGNDSDVSVSIED